VLTAGTGISLTDGGAGGNLTISNTGAGQSSSWVDTGAGIYTTASVAIDPRGRVATVDGSDTFFYVSGSIGNKFKSVFGGDVVASGSITSQQGFTGSLTQLTSGLPYIVGLGTVSITTNSLGQVIISGSSSGGGGSNTVTGSGGTVVTLVGSVYTVSSSIYADKFSSYLVTSASTNPEARIIAAGTNITLVDNGPGGTLTINAATGSSAANSNFWSDSGNGIFATSSVAIDPSGHPASAQGSDVIFYVSGTRGLLPGIVNRHVGLFGADVFSSGSISAINGFTGSLTQLVNGLPYLIALGSITITTNSLGQVIISGSGGSSGATTVTGTGGTLVTNVGSAYTVSSSVGADLYASYLTVSGSGFDPNGRIFTAGSNITLVDNGPGGSLIISAIASGTTTNVTGAGGSSVSQVGSTYTVSSSIGADIFASYLLVSSNGNDTKARVLTAGSNVTFSDSGPGGNLTINASTGSSGASSGFSVVPLSSCVSSTGNDATNAKKVGGISFNATSWSQLKNTSTIKFHMLLETTNASNVASGSLMMYTGIGSPQTIAVLSTSSLNTADLFTDVSSFFRSGSNPGIFLALLNLTTNNGTDFATSTSAWLEITP